jgi:sugar lactone lactonase YvrE
VFGLAGAVLLAASGCRVNPPRAPVDITIDDTRVFPESVTSTSAGGVIVGSMKGIVYRAAPTESVARPWIEPDATNGLQAIFGVLADERSQTLWVCSVANPFDRSATPTPSALVAFDLSGGRYKASYPLPGEHAVCNDIAVGLDSTVYATDTSNGRLLELRRGAKALAIYAQDERLKGIDGLAFAESGVLYVNIVSRGALMRVDRDAAGKMHGLKELTLSRPISGPDGFRPLAGNRFLLAEGSGGRIDEVTIDGDTANIRTLREGLDGSPGVTRVDGTAYAFEGKIRFLIDPAMKGKDPGTFTIHAIPLH